MRTGGKFGGSLWPYLRVTIVSAVCVWGIAEAGYGLMQVLGWRSSRHALFALTGHFQNPGPFGGFIACVIAVAGAWVMGSPVKPGMTKERMGTKKMTTIVSVFAWAALGMGLLVLPASMSRAGWLGLAVALGVEWMRSPIRSGMTKEGSGMPQPSRHAGQRSGIWWVAGVALCLALLVGAFLLKPDSALGRLHVWRMECRAIAERPWTGAGPGMGPWAYGDAQEAFFREHLETASAATIRVAGCPDYAYNEYLKIGVEYGILVMVLFVLLVVSSIVVLHKAGSPLAAGLTAWAVFAFASYPLAVPQLRILGVVFIISGVISGLLMIPNKVIAVVLAALVLVATGWMGFASPMVGISHFARVAARSRRMTETGQRMTENGWRMMRKGDREREEARAVYAEGYALHLAGRYEESTRLLEKGARMSCDPMFEIIMGKNAEALGDCEKAAALYGKAHYMVPSRLYPLVRLMRLQIRQGQDAKALETARQIVAMPVNGRNAGMVRLHEETQKTLDSLIVVTRR